MPSLNNDERFLWGALGGSSIPLGILGWLLFVRGGQVLLEYSSHPVMYFAVVAGFLSVGGTFALICRDNHPIKAWYTGFSALGLIACTAAHLASFLR